MDCIFCRIANHEIPSNIILENNDVMAFYDLDPKAPVHFLVIPKEHIESADDINAGNSAVIAKIFEAIAKIAEKLGLKDGYRVVNNCGESAGQTVTHLHFHVLSGRDMTWPPG